MKLAWIAPWILLVCAACSDSDLDIPVKTDAGKPPSLVEIYAPNSGDTLPADTPFTLEFAVVRGGDGEYVEVRIDQQKPVKIARVRGHHLIKGLAPGRHTIAVTEFDKQGKPTGGHTSVTIQVK